MSPQAPFDELILSVVRSVNFSDVDELDIWELLGG